MIVRIGPAGEFNESAGQAVKLKPRRDLAHPVDNQLLGAMANAVHMGTGWPPPSPRGTAGASPQLTQPPRVLR